MPPRLRAPRLSGMAALAAIAIMMAACSAASGPPTPSGIVSAEPSPTPSHTPSATSSPTADPTPVAPPTPSPTATFTVDPVIVTFNVSGEVYRVRLTEPVDIEMARQLLAGESLATIPYGEVLPGDGGINQPWSWHIDPATFEFAEVTIEVCDGRPSMVESGVVEDSFCPWDAELIEIEEAGDQD